MNIYVDFDDCLCETARYFSGLIDRMFGLDIPYEKIRYFDLQKSFSLTDDDFEKMLRESIVKHDQMKKDRDTTDND